MAGHHTFLQDQVATAKEIAKESGGYDEDNAVKDLQSAIDDFSNDINHRIKQLDQTVRDLLQFVSIIIIIFNKFIGVDLVQEFAWVSINEAHRSANIATSMKRLSWITVRFYFIVTHLAEADMPSSFSYQQFLLR